MHRIVLAATAAIGLATAAHATDLTVGVDGEAATCKPFTCGFGLGTYQQFYAASAFTNGPMVIDAVSFFLDDKTVRSGRGDILSFRLEFYTTPKVFAGRDEGGPDFLDLDNNLGTLLSDFGQFLVSGVTPDVLTFTGPAFTYDPTAGNLLMQVTPLFASAGFDGAFLQSDSSGAVTWRVLPLEFTGIGLVTRFSSPTPAVGGVPEPGTWALMLLGFGAAGAAIRRRRLRLA